MDTNNELKELLKREVEVIPITYDGQSGYIAEYFNFSDRNNVSKLFSETKEGALENLLKHIKENQPGGKDGVDTISS